MYHPPLIAFAASLICWLVLEYSLLFSRRGKRSERRDHHTKTIIGVWIVAGVITSGLADHFLPFALLPGPDSIYFIVATVCIILGLLLRLWAVHTLGRFFTVAITIQTDHTVIQNGPYRYVRHPSYTAILIVVVGIGIALHNVVALVALFTCIFLGLKQRMDVEEAELIKNLGPQYAEYRSHHARIFWHLY